MQVNGVSILSTYKAKLLSKEIQSAEVTVYDDWLRKALNPLYIGKQTSFKKITMQILVADTTDDDCLLDISNLMSQLQQCTIKFDDIDFYYDCTLASTDHGRLIVQGNYVLNIEMKSGYAYLAEVTETLDQVDHIHITALGNLPSPAKVTITPTTNLAALTITGFESVIELHTLLQNVPVVIDGVLCTIIQNGGNKFADVDMWSFPVLNPGAQTISLDSASCVVTIKYKPKFM